MLGFVEVDRDISLFESSLFPSGKSSVSSLLTQEVERGMIQVVMTDGGRLGLCSGDLLWPLSSGRLLICETSGRGGHSACVGAWGPHAGLGGLWPPALAAGSPSLRGRALAAASDTTQLPGALTSGAVWPGRPRGRAPPRMNFHSPVSRLFFFFL